MSNSQELLAAEQAVRKILTYYLKFLKNQQAPATVSIESVTVDVLSGVFQSGTDARLLGAHLKSYVEGRSRRVLDMGSGSGVLAVLAGSYDARGVAADISPAAVANMQHNFDSSGVNFTAVKSDVFTGIAPQKFDLIIATPPYLEGEILEPLDHSVYGISDFVEKFLKDADRYLTKTGKVLITFGQWSPLQEIEQKIQDYGWRSRIIESRKSGDGERSYNLYELRR
jgi:methylase of polypeptide subunit release factors